VAAFSFIEILFVLGTAATVSAVAVPETLATIDDSRTAAAARYVSTRLQRARMEAVTRSGSAALRFTRQSDHYDFTTYIDTNHNGVLSKDIQSGIDRAIQPADRLGNHFPGVDFGAIPDLPAADPSSTAPGSDPIRLGSSDMVTFTSTGTATSGSLYIRGRRNAQYVVRVYGETGKTRVLKFLPGSGQWIPASGL
jgi:type II secretory pathway pseudopilin PulG